VHRAISLIAVLGLFYPLLTAWGEVIAVPSAGLAAVALAAGGLWLVLALATASTGDELARLDRWLLALALLVLAAWTASRLNASPGYATDEASIEQGAATLLLHGHDPYGANLAGALAAFSTPSKYLTYTMSGGLVTTFGYPSLPLLVVAPFVELTGGGQAVPIADMFVLMLATVILFGQLPRTWRGLSVVVCVGFPILASFAITGMNLIIASTALMLAAYRWTSVGDRSRLTRREQLQAVALGLALASNQLGWFIAPFLLTGIYLLRRSGLGQRKALKVTLRWACIAVGTFVVLNAPFFLWGPSAWLQGVAAPLTQHAIPYGQGLVGLTLFLRLGGGALDAYDYAAGLLYLALLVLYVTRFRTMGRACFILPLLALFVSGRSLAEYWMTTIPVVLIGVVTADPLAIRSVSAVRGLSRASRRAHRAATAALFVPAAIWLVVALSTPQPLQMRVLSAHSASLDSVSAVRLLVRNTSDTALRPRFAVNVTGQAVLWRSATGRAILPPRASAVYRLVAPDVGSMPANDTPFVVEAVTATPRTISSTATFTHAGQAPGNW
jgi:uncharacterized membrane protein